MAIRSLSTCLVLFFLLGTFYPPQAYSSPSFTAPTLTPSDPEIVTIQLRWSHGFQFAGYYAAIEQGFYAEEGVNVVLRQRVSTEPRDSAVLNGSAQYGISDATLLKSRLEGQPVVLLAQIFQHSPMVFISKKGSGIQTPYEMVGKRVMCGSNDEFLLALLLEIIGETGTVAIDRGYSFQDFMTDKVDVITTYMTNKIFELKQQGIETNIIDLRSYGVDLYGDNLYTSEEEIRNHPLRVEKIIRATLKGWVYALQHKDELIDLIVDKYHNGQGRAILEYEAKVVKNLIMPQVIPLGKINQGRYRNIFAIYQRINVTQQDEIPDKFFYKRNSIFKLTTEERLWLKNNPVLRVAINNSFPPVEFFDGEGRAQGIAVDYLRQLEALLNVEFDFCSIGSWRATVEGLQLRTLDVAAAIQQTDSRKEYLGFTETYLNMDVGVFARGNHYYINDLRQLNGKRVAVLDKSFIHDAIKIDYPDIELVPVATSQVALLALTTGKVDAIIDVLSFVNYYTAKLGLGQVEVVGLTPYKWNLAMAARNDQPLLVSIMRKALHSISKAERDRIAHKWFEVQYSDPPDYSLLWKGGIPVAVMIVVILLWNRSLFKEIGRRKMLEKALVESEQRFRSIVEGLGEDYLIYVIDLERNFTYVSPSVWDFGGMSSADIIGKNWNQVVSAVGLCDESIERLKHVLQMCFNGDIPPQCEVMRRDISGDVSYQEVAVHPVFDDSGNVVCVEGITKQITVYKQVAAKLKLAIVEAENAKISAEAASRAKSSFLANMSHELRTPLTAILGYSNLLQRDKSLPQNVQRDITSINRSGQHLCDIIDEILTIYQMESGWMGRSNKFFKLNDLFENMHDMFRLQLVNKGLELTVVGDNNMLMRLVGDEKKLYQIMINLLSNAIKFTDAGTICITVDCQKLSNGKVRLNIAVQDSGVGIAHDELVKLFHPFEQGSIGKTKGGTGLGLVISRQYARSMGGDLTVSSKVGQGSVFTVECVMELDRRLPDKDLNVVSTELLPDDSDPALAGQIYISQEQLAGIPAQLRDELQQAIFTLMPARIESSIGKISIDNPQIGEALQRLAREYRYDKLSELFSDEANGC